MKVFDLVDSSRIFTAEQALADEIFIFLNKRVSFPRIMFLIKREGRQKVYEVFNEVKQKGVKNPPALFIWKLK